MPDKPQSFLVSTLFELNNLQRVETIDRLFNSIDDVSAYAEGVTIPDLVGRALDEGVNLERVDAILIGLRIFEGPTVAYATTIREWESSDLAEFRNPPAEVLDGFVPSAV